MRLRVELLAGAALAVALCIGAAALGSRRARFTDADPRRSTFLAGPSGALAYVQTLQRLGVRVERFRRAPSELGSVLGSVLSDTSHALVAVLGPIRALSAREARTLVKAPADLLLAGPGVSAALHCFGYRSRPARHDTLRARAVLIEGATRIAADSLHLEDGVRVTCTAPPATSADTVLRTSDGVAAVRLHYADGRSVMLVADDALFSNRALRFTEAGPFAVGLIVPRYRRVIVDEYHHGFASSGSLARTLWQWSLRSPWGWAAWQLALVGVLALLASGVRFGPVRHVIDRRRRSPLEHVRALATALAAARGHGVAVDLMTRGLRRRLSRGQPGRDDPGAWLEGLDDTVRTTEGRRALATLRELTGRSVDTEGVRRAANAVEDVWEELTTPSPDRTPSGTLPLMPRPPRRS